MATSANELSIVIKAVVDGLIGPVQKAKSEVQDFAKSTESALDKVEERSENLRHVWKDLFEAFIGIEIVDVLKKIADGANDAAEKLKIAANTARNFGNSIDPQAMEKWLQAFAASSAGGGFQLPEMRSGVQEFAARGLDSNQIKRATADATNLAATFGLQLPEAVHIINEALTGHVEMLSRYGIISREAAKNIHTVEDAMRALEQASKGGAEERANGLAGAFGRMSNSVQNLANSFGQYLIPYFDGAANAIGHIANAFNKLPDGVKEAAAGFAFATFSLTALGLMLPAVKLGVEFIGNAFAILGTPVSIAADALKMFGNVVAGPLLSAMATLGKSMISLATEGVEMLSQAFLKMSVATLRGSVMSAFEGVLGYLGRVGAGLLSLMAPITTVIGGWIAEGTAAVAAWAATIAPIAAVIAAIALIGLAIYEVVKHWDTFKAGAAAALNWVGDRIHDFIEFAKQQFQSLGSILHGVWDFLTGNRAAGLSEMQSGLHGVVGGWKAVGAAAFEAGKKGVEAVNGWLQHQAWFKAAENMVKGFFSGNLGKTPNIPGEAFTGNIPGGAKGANAASDTAAKAATDALKNFNEATANWLASFQDKVDAAQAVVDASKAKLDTFTAGLPGGKPQTEEQEAKYQSLLNAELRAEQTLRQATLEKQKAEVEAADKYQQIAKAVSPHLKNHDDLVRSALDAARQHHTEAQRLLTTYEQLGVTLAQIKATQRDIHDQTVEARADAARQSSQYGLDAQLNANSAQVEAIDHARNMMAQAHGGTLTAVQGAQFNVQLAQLALSAAQDREAFAKHAAALAQDTAKQTGLLADKQKAVDAENQSTAAHNATIASENRLEEAQDALTKAMREHTSQLTQALDELVKKLNIPGLQQNATGGFTFNPMMFLVQAFSQTKAFADVMGFVNQLMKVFAQLLDNLRPILDVVLTVVRSVANVFIFLYNTVAHILRLFGIHLQLLQQINGAYSDQIPLIQITHNIPTLNELAAGKLSSPLSNTPTGYKSLSDIGQTHTSLLQSILGTLVAILAVESIFGHGHGGGIGGLLSGLFGHGASGVNMSGVASTGDLVSSVMGTAPAVNMSGVAATGDLVNSMTQGVAGGLGMDGASSSGGLFTAMSGGLQAASPVLAGAIGAVLGGMLSGGGMGGPGSILGALGSIAGTAFGGPLGGAIGGLVGGLLGGLFGGHKSAPSAPATPQNTGFTDLLHKGTDVHAWLGLNQLNASISGSMRAMQNTANSMAKAADALVKASGQLGASASLTANNTFGDVHIHDGSDVNELSRTLSNETQRTLRTFQYSIARGPLG